MEGRRGKGFNRIESEDGLRAFNLKVFGTRARTQEVSLSELPALTGYAIRACSLSDRGVFSGVFVYAVETAIQTLQSSTPELAPHLETPDPVVDTGMRQPECGDDSDHTQLSIRNVLRLSFRGEFEWVGEIIGYYMIRHVLMHTGGPSQDSAMEPIRYWLYSYTETDVAMVAAAVLGLATSDTLHGRYPQRESVILDEHKIRIASLAKIISTSLMNGTRHYKQVYDDRVCKKLPGAFPENNLITWIWMIAIYGIHTINVRWRCRQESSRSRSSQRNSRVWWR